MSASPLFRLSALALSWAALVCAVAAQPAAPPVPPSERASRRFPQPVRAGDLVGRTVLAAKEEQPILGRVAGIVRQSDGSTRLVIAESRWFGIGARPVAVPLDAVGLLGEYVALLDVTPEQLRASATFADPSAAAVPPDDIIRVGLAKPFH